MVSLRNRIEKLKFEILELKLTLSEKEGELNHLLEESECDNQKNHNFTNRDVIRYSRQIIVPQIKVKGQLKLKETSVLIVGVGGLGCPAAMYLAAAGLGHIGLVDYDIVEENNLHRQILHNEEMLGKPKVESAAYALKKINRSLVVDQYKIQLSSSNALDIIRKYKIVVDATDNVASRYLVSDACVLAGCPLVSGSALQLEGQMTVYNHCGGPCYRCLYPQPPSPEVVTNCSDAGVLGPVPGVIGILQALEVIKIALGMTGVLSSKLLLFDGEDSSFRTIKLRKKSENCPVCGLSPSITQLIDYEEFCGAAANDKDKELSLLNNEERISAKELSHLLESSGPCVVVDVRQEAEYEMCSIPGSVNLPLASLTHNIDKIHQLVKDQADDPNDVTVCMVCRRGNDSQLAVRRLQPFLSLRLRDLRGGLHAWAAAVNPQFPVY